MKSSLRVLAWLIGIPLGLVLGVMLLSLIASVIPSKAKRSLPREMSDVREFTSSYGFDSDYGLTAKGQLSAEQFRRQRPRGNKRKIISSLREILSEALEFNRSEARKAAEDNYTEELVTV
jgi:hypothetical protein